MTLWELAALVEGYKKAQPGYNAGAGNMTAQAADDMLARQRATVAASNGKKRKRRAV